MIKNIKVVVWCLAYNQARFIRNALDGFVMQKTNFSFEVIVHDDKSTDGTTDIILEYAKRYPDIIIPVIEAENQWTKGGLVRIIDIMNEQAAATKEVDKTGEKTISPERMKEANELGELLKKQKPISIAVDEIYEGKMRMKEYNPPVEEAEEVVETHEVEL